MTGRLLLRAWIEPAHEVPLRVVISRHDEQDEVLEEQAFTDDAVHELYNDMMRGVGTQLLGRRMYETMVVWETDPAFYEESAVLADFAAAWQDSDKIVFSTTES